ncbi:MAG: nitroreductase family protein [Armatimonadota bacterium]|nr:nitroreductase family protein [Armatimonadota bacterium]
MDVMEAIRERFSVRKFKHYEIEEGKLETVLEAARLAPSARNLQEWRFVVVRDPRMREALAEAANGQRFVGEAPVVIVGCAISGEHVMSCGLHCFPIDVAIAMTHMTLAAVEQGLGTCWIGAFNADKVQELLGIPEEVIVVGLLPIGYPATEAPPKKRLSLDDIVMAERWQG